MCSPIEITSEMVEGAVHELGRHIGSELLDRCAYSVDTIALAVLERALSHSPAKCGSSDRNVSPLVAAVLSDVSYQTAEAEVRLQYENRSHVTIVRVTRAG